jgi:hypothetical protein
MSDQEAWHELCSLYLSEGEYGKAAFCMEEVLLHNPYSHLIHQRLADIRYTMVSFCSLSMGLSINTYFRLFRAELKTSKSPSRIMLKPSS